MSLFKSRVWWEINLNENELYDSQSILIWTLEKSQNQSILIGNHEGLLRLFLPRSETNEDIHSFKPSDLLLEVQLSSPILQIKNGILVSGSQNKYLAILHPRLFSVYAIKKKEGKESNMGDEMMIELAYQHSLRHSAHSFVVGSFGGIRSRNFICIQSLDGLLSFYEQESFAFQVYLPEFSLPFNFIYLEKSDSFLFLNGLMILNSFSYEALALASSSNEKKITKIWELNIGEGILEMKAISKIGLTILLTEKNFYGLNEGGKVIFMKRLEYKPVAIFSYLTEEDKLMNIIANDTKYLYLYEETNLKWAMKIDEVPVSMKRIFLNDLPGGITLLSENGYLQVLYIGTHPSIYLIPPLIQADIDFQKSEGELKKLKQKITENDFADPLTADLVTVKLKIDKNLKVTGNIKMCDIMIEINTQCPVSKIQVLFMVEPPLAATNQSVVIRECSDSTIVESSIYKNRIGITSNLQLQVVTTYLIAEGVTKSIQKTGILPLNLVMVETEPVKEAQHKITLSTNKPVCGLNNLFGEFLTEENSPHAIGLKFINSEESVTILAAKSSQKYRFQADSLAAISLLLSTLIERLKIYFRKDKDFSLTYSSSLPLDGFFEKIAFHHNLLKTAKSVESNLSKQNSQYRTIQKKILLNLKDVTPKPASNLQKLLRDTSQLILSGIDEIQKLEEEVFLSKCCLRSLNRTVISLLELMGVRDKDLKYLKTAFDPNTQDTERQGWLEVQEAATLYLLRTIFAKSIKDQQKPTEILLEPMKDTSTLAKHLTSAVDRVTKGTYLMERNEFENKKDKIISTQTALKPQQNFLEDIIPTGSKFFDLKTIKSESVENDIKDVTEFLKENKEKTEKTQNLASEVETKKQSTESKRQELEENSEKSKLIAESNIFEDADDDDADAIWDLKIEEMKI